MARNLVRSAFAAATKIIPSQDAAMTEVIAEMQHVQTPSKDLFHRYAKLALEELLDLRDPSFDLGGSVSL